jgi:hypothetical protein
VAEGRLSDFGLCAVALSAASAEQSRAIGLAGSIVGPAAFVRAGVQYRANEIGGFLMAITGDCRVSSDRLIFFDCFSKQAHLRRPGQLIRSTRGADQGSVDRQDHGRESCVSRVDRGSVESGRPVSLLAAAAPLTAKSARELRVARPLDTLFSQV